LAIICQRLTQKPSKNPGWLKPWRFAHMGCACGKKDAVQDVHIPEDADSRTRKKISAPSTDVIARKIEQAKKTGALALRECGLKSMPPTAVGEGTSGFRTVDLTNNSIKSLPQGVESWTCLQKLLGADNALTELPPAVGQMVGLQSLVLTSNQLRTLPAEMSLLRKLTILQLDKNKLGPTLPDVFGGVLAESLEELNLSSNGIKELAPTLSGLRVLTRLVIARNEISQLPESLGELSKLQYLDAEHNKLATIPSSLLERTNLSELCLKGNPMERLQLQKLQGFDTFLERRKQIIDAKIDSHVVGRVDLTVCGLE